MKQKIQQPFVTKAEGGMSAKRKKTLTNRQGFDDTQQQVEYDLEYSENEYVEASPVEFINHIWKAKYFVIFCSALFALLAVLLISGKKYFVNEDIYAYPIEFTFSGVKEDKYPNGTNFQLTDINSSAILSKVYDKLGLGDQDLPIEEFFGLVSVQSYTPNRQAIIKKYQTLFDSRKSTLAELQQNQNDMNNELTTESKSSAIINFRNINNIFPTSIATSIPAEIAKEWSQAAINQNGVSREDISVISAASFAPEKFENLSKLSIIADLNQKSTQLLNVLIEVQAVSGGNLLKDEISKLSIADLKNEINAQLLKLRDLSAAWASEVAGTDEALQTERKLFSGKIFEEQKIDELDYLVTVDRFEKNITLISDNLDEILNDRLGAVVTDPKTGLNVFEIQELLRQKKEFDLAAIRAPILQLGLAKNFEALNIYYTSQLSDLEREQKELQKLKQLFESIIDGTFKNSALNEVSTNRSLPGSTTVIPQLSEGFIDKLLALSEQGDNSEFRKQLSEEVISISRKEVKIATEIEKVREYFNVVNRNSANQSSISDSAKAKIEAAVKKQLEDLKNTLVVYTNATLNIAQTLAFANGAHKILEPVEFFEKVIEDPENPENNIVSKTANPNFFALTYYLRDVKQASEIFLNILNALSNHAGAVNRIVDKSSAIKYGSIENLYRPLGSSELLSENLVSTRSILLLVVMTLFGFFASLGYVVLRKIFP